MELILTLISYILHLDQHLLWLISEYGLFIYAILFLIIFCETGFVITPFLPGDSLLFATGALAAAGSLNLALLFLLLSLAAILGDTVNYWVGTFVGPVVYKKKVPYIKREYITRTHRFFEKYGGKAIILARFVPIIRTFAPFLAGVGTMKYPKFLLYNIIGGIAWVSLFLFGGYYFGNLPWVKENFTLVLIAIIIISFIPVVTEFLKHRK